MKNASRFRYPSKIVRQFFTLGCGILAAATVQANVPGGGNTGPDVTLKHDGKDVVLSNGIVTATIDTSLAEVQSIKFKGKDMVNVQGGHDAIYFSRDGGTDYEQLPHCVYALTKQTPDVVDISCKHIYSPSQKDKHAWDVDVHFVLLRGATDLYVYTINSHPAAYPAMAVGEWRMVWPMPQHGNDYVLENMYIDDLRHWKLANAYDGKHAAAVSGAPKEVTQFTTGERAGQYDCKYIYVTDYWDVHCWGYASDVNHLGGWLVFGSDEFFTDGPMKQDLTATMGPLNLVHLNMNHYDGTGPELKQGESWQKVYGPYLLYFNDKATGDECWKDAQAQAEAEAKAWPYAWLDDNQLYPTAKGRGTVTGDFLVRDTLKPDVSSANAWVGLAAPEDGREGGFQFQSGGYQYWVHADKSGNFVIPSVRPGHYTLYAFTTGAVGEYSKTNVLVAAGQTTSLGRFGWAVPHKGSKIAWEIGVPDRRSTEFKHGDDYFTPMLFWKFPHEFSNPLEYYVGKSDWHTDWNYAQSYFYEGDKRVPHRWRIHFNLKETPDGISTLTLALAASHDAKLDVYVNSDTTVLQHLTPKFLGGNALVRESDHAKYEVDYVSIPAGKLKSGENTITLVQTRTDSDQASIMYDYLDLETP